MLNAANANQPRKPLQQTNRWQKKSTNPAHSGGSVLHTLMVDRIWCFYLRSLFARKKNRACVLAELKSKLKLNFIIHFLTAYTVRASVAFVDGCSAIWHPFTVFCGVFSISILPFICAEWTELMCIRNDLAPEIASVMANDGSIYTIKLMLHGKNK